MTDPLDNPEILHVPRFVVEEDGTQYLVDEASGEILGWRPSEAPERRSWDTFEADPIVLGAWLIELSEPAARILLYLVDKITERNRIDGEFRLLADDAGFAGRAHARARTELLRKRAIRIERGCVYLNPSIAYKAPFGMKNGERPYRVHAWYTSSDNPPYVRRLTSVDAYGVLQRAPDDADNPPPSVPKEDFLASLDLSAAPM